MYNNNDNKTPWLTLLIACLAFCLITTNAFAVSVPQPPAAFEQPPNLEGFGPAPSLDADSPSIKINYIFTNKIPNPDSSLNAPPEIYAVTLNWSSNLSPNKYSLQYVDSDNFADNSDWKELETFSGLKHTETYIDHSYGVERRRYYRVVALSDDNNIMMTSPIMNVYEHQKYIWERKRTRTSKTKSGYNGFNDDTLTRYKKWTYGYSRTSSRCGESSDPDNRNIVKYYERVGDEYVEREDPNPDPQATGISLEIDNDKLKTYNDSGSNEVTCADEDGNEYTGTRSWNESASITLSNEFTDGELKNFVDELTPSIDGVAWEIYNVWGESENYIEKYTRQLKEHAFLISPKYQGDFDPLRWFEITYNTTKKDGITGIGSVNTDTYDGSTSEQEPLEKYYRRANVLNKHVEVKGYDWDVSMADYRGGRDRYESARIHVGDNGDASKRSAFLTVDLWRALPYVSGVSYATLPPALEWETTITWSSDVLQVQTYNEITESYETLTSGFTIVPDENTSNSIWKIGNRKYVITVPDNMESKSEAVITVTTNDGNGNTVASKEFRIVLIQEDPNHFNIPFADATGPKYRKITLNGRPLSDEKPQATSESDEAKEETYIDAFNLNLVHSVTDIYQPIPGSELAFTVRRNLQPEIWNLRNGLRPHEQPARPFGSGWSTNLTSYIKISTPDGPGIDGFEEPITADVIDEQGNRHHFVKYLNDWFPLPTAQHEAKAYLTSLAAGPGGFTFKQKHGNTLVFKSTPISQPISRDRLMGSQDYNTYEYARLDSVQDRLGYRLRYHYSGNETLIPSMISAERPGGAVIPNQQLFIRQNDDDHVITAVWDANGNQISYDYTTRSFTPDELGYVQGYHLLIAVNAPDGGQTQYQYNDNNTHVIEFEPDTVTREIDDPRVHKYHLNLTQITDSLGNSYHFTYDFDQSKQIYSSKDGYVVQTGNPRNVTRVTLPGNIRIDFENLNNAKDKRLHIEFDSAGTGKLVGARSNTVTRHINTEMETETDAEDFTTTYEFSGTKIVILRTFKDALISSGGLTSVDKFEDPRLVYYTTMTVTHGNYGSEIFTFDPAAGLALSSVTDFSGNKTTFAYNDNWHTPADSHFFHDVWSEGFTRYADPTHQTNALGDSKQFVYDRKVCAHNGVPLDPPTFRVMTCIIDEEGRKTEYSVDNKGRRLDERIYAAVTNQLIQKSSFEYDSNFPGVIAKQTLENLGGASSAAIVTAYSTDNNGRINTQTTYPNIDADAGTAGPLTTTYNSYDWNNNRLAITDPKSKITVFAYDDRNRLTKVTHHDDRFTEMAYDSRGRTKSEVDENGHATLFEYDQLNRLLRQARDMNSNLVIDPADLTTKLGYNNVNAKTHETDPNGNTTRFAYDNLQRITKIIDAESGVTTFNYDESKNPGGGVFDVSGFKPTSTTDPRGFVTDVTYDALYRPVETRVEYNSGDFAKTVNVYDNVGNLTKITDPLGKITQTKYDALNRPTQVTYHDNTHIETTYTTTDLIWKVTDERGNTTESHYDGLGRPIKVIDPAVTGGQPITKTFYDAAGNVNKTINPLGNSWEYEHDDRHRLVVERQPLVSTIRTNYDHVGNVTSVTDPRGNVTTTTYDNANRPIKVTLPIPGNPTLHTNYDQNGNIFMVTDANGHTTENTYDKLNRLKTTMDAEGITVSYDYDKVGNRTKLTDGQTQATTFTYDGLNRLLTTTDHSGKTSSLSYNAVNQTERIDSKGDRTEYEYYDRHRLKTVSYIGATDQDRSYEYDPNGNILAVIETGKGGKTDVAYTYDALNRIETDTSGGLTHTYTYDLAGNRKSTVYGGTGRTISSDYDALNRLEKLIEGHRITEYRYDLNSNIVFKKLPNGQSIDNTYDELNRVTLKEGKQSNGNVLYRYGMNYDAVCNVIYIDETYSGKIANRTITNTYDDIDRLTMESIHRDNGAPDIITDYSYDDAHNRKSMDRSDVSGITNYTYNRLNQLTNYSTPSSDIYTFGYDSNGNRTHKTHESTGTDQTYTYDRENRLVQVILDEERTIKIYPGTTPNDDVTQADYIETGNIYKYDYDYRTRRVERKEPNKPATKVVFSGGLSIQEYDGGQNTPSVEYIRGSDYGGGIGGVLYTLRDGTASYSHYNNRGDVTAKTNASGALTYQAAYEAFGTHGSDDPRTQEWGNTEDRQKANTKDEDPTGLLNEGFRYRDLETGSFITRDPLGFVDGPNMYTYVVQNPWSNFDPHGLSELLRKLGNTRLASALNKFHFAWRSIAVSAAFVAAPGESLKIPNPPKTAREIRIEQQEKREKGNQSKAEKKKASGGDGTGKPGGKPSMKKELSKQKQKKNRRRAAKKLKNAAVKRGKAVLKKAGPIVGTIVTTLSIANEARSEGIVGAVENEIVDNVDMLTTPLANSIEVASAALNGLVSLSETKPIKYMGEKIGETFIIMNEMFTDDAE